MEFHRGLVRAYDATTHTAAVLLAGSMSRVILGIPVAHHIAPHLMAVGTPCGVAFFAEGSQGVIVCTFVGPATIPGCHITRAAAKSIPNATWTPIDFDTEIWDPLAMHDNATNNTRITATLPGKYTIRAGARYAAAAGGQYRSLQLRLNGTTELVIEGHPAAVYPSTHVERSTHLATGQYAELLVYQDSGAAMTVSNLWADMLWTGP